MMQCKAQLSTRLCLFVCAAATGLGLALAMSGGRAGEAEVEVEAEAPAGMTWTPGDADLFNLVTVCAITLGLLALLLLWRQHQSNQAHHYMCAREREQERQRIGRDIHDDLGQHLLTLKIDLAMLQKSVPPQLAQQLAMMVSNVDLSISSLRCVIDDLRPPALEQGLKGACNTLLAEFSRVHGIACDCILEHDTRAGRHDTLLYRVLQEALANIARHARATRVSVSLLRPRTGGVLHFNIADNGIGIGIDMVGAHKGCGLAGMRERLLAAGGKLDIVRQDGGGTCVHLTLPY